MKSTRRRKSVDLFRQSISSDEMKKIMDDIVMDIIAGEKDGKFHEDQLQSLLTAAKQSGMSVEDIFSFFFSDRVKHYVSIENFRSGIVRIAIKLGRSIDIKKINEIAKNFDINGDGEVSIVEFKLYCFNIPSIAWKAAKRRMENIGSINELRKISKKMRAVARVKAEEAKGRMRRKSPLMLERDDGRIPCGSEVFRSTKIFWKTNTSVDVRMFYCEPLDIVTMQMFDQSDKGTPEIPNIYVFKSTCDVGRVIKSAEFEESLEGAFMRAGVRDKEEAAVVTDTAVWQVIGRYLLARLEVTFPKQNGEERDGGAKPLPFLRKLTRDGLDTLMVKRPEKLEPPPTTKAGSAVEKDFKEGVANLSATTRKARASRETAEKLNKLAGLSFEVTRELTNANILLGWVTE